MLGSAALGWVTDCGGWGGGCGTLLSRGVRGRLVNSAFVIGFTSPSGKSFFFSCVGTEPPPIGENAVGLSFHKSYIIQGKKNIYSIYKSMLIYVLSINPLNVVTMF